MAWPLVTFPVSPQITLHLVLSAPSYWPPCCFLSTPGTFQHQDVALAFSPIFKWHYSPLHSGLCANVTCKERPSLAPSLTCHCYTSCWMLHSASFLTLIPPWQHIIYIWGGGLIFVSHIRTRAGHSSERHGLHETWPVRMWMTIWMSEPRPVCFFHYGTTHGSQTECGEGNMGEMGLTIEVRGGPQLGSRCEG